MSTLAVHLSPINMSSLRGGDKKFDFTITYGPNSLALSLSPESTISGLLIGEQKYIVEVDSEAAGQLQKKMVYGFPTNGFDLVGTAYLPDGQISFELSCRNHGIWTLFGQKASWNGLVTVQIGDRTGSCEFAP